MPRTRRSHGPLIALLDEPDAGPLWSRLCDTLRARITSGALVPGARLPAARVMARDLSVSRHTVEAALAELEAQGLLTRRAGAGTFVAPHVERDQPPIDARRAARRRAAPPPLAPRGSTLASFGQVIAGSRRAFAPCAGAGDSFPHALWARLTARCARELGRGAVARDEPEPQGHLPLRDAIAAHVAHTRGLRCAAGDVLVLQSTQEALLLCAQTLFSPGDRAWVEDPGYRGAHAAFRAAALDVCPVPVDAEGLDVDAARRLAPRARLAYVTPSCQFPTGVTLSPRRRTQLLAWAHASDAVLLEDDYDSELRYQGRPLAAVAAADGGTRTLYVGTFNKCLFPTLRLAYLVAPPALIDALTHARVTLGGPPPTLTQATLAAFMQEGHLGAHLRRLRETCDERRSALRDAVTRDLDPRVTLHAGDTGQHALLYLPPGSDDEAVSRRAAARGLDAPPLSRYAFGPRPPPGLVLSFAAATPAEIRAGVHVLATCLHPAGRS